MEGGGGIMSLLERFCRFLVVGVITFWMVELYFWIYSLDIWISIFHGSLCLFRVSATTIQLCALSSGLALLLSPHFYFFMVLVIHGGLRQDLGHCVWTVELWMKCFCQRQNGQLRNSALEKWMGDEEEEDEGRRG